MQVVKELQRRNVFRVAVGYVVSCWLLAQVADLVLDNIGAPDWVMQTIMLLLALGFPVVLFFSWAYEVTPEGIRRETEVDRSDSITHVTGRKLDRAITAVLAVALCYFIYDKYFANDVNDARHEQAAMDIDDAAFDEHSQSIAVLPFANMSADQSERQQPVARRLSN